LFKSLRMLALAPVLAATLFGYAGLPAAANGLPAYSAGLIDQSGTVDAGTGFTVQHTGTGLYTVTYPTGTFNSFPVITVTPFGINGHACTAIVSSEGGTNGGLTFVVQLTDKVNKAKNVDNAFGFTLLES
jgi:hypothetical protein